MLESQLKRFLEFRAPILAYRAGEMDREQLLTYLLEYKEDLGDRIDELLDTIDKDQVLKEQHPKIFEKVKESTKLFDDATEMLVDAVEGEKDEEEPLFEQALEVFRKGNLMLNDASDEVEDLWEEEGNLGVL